MIVQDALEHVTPVGFILLRFTVGAVVLLPFALVRGWRRPGVDASGRAFTIAVLAFGGIAFVGYWFQNAGLERTTTSNSAFITGLFVVFTPSRRDGRAAPRAATQRPRRGRRRHRRAVPPHRRGPSLNSGDLLTLGCAFFFGIWIYMGGRLSQRYDPVMLTALQLVIVAVLAVPVVAVMGSARSPAR